MSAIVACPECKRKLKVPDTAVGKTIRCPACKALIPPASTPAVDSENDGPNRPSPRHAVQTAPSPQSAAARPRPRPAEDEEPEDEDIASEEEEPVRKKPAKKRRSARKKSSLGLTIGLPVGGVTLLAVLIGFGIGLARSLLRDRNIPEAEWQLFAPPNGNCTALMPGTPRSQPLMTNGITVNKYVIERKREHMIFAVAFADLGNDPLPPNVLDEVTKAERDNLTQVMKGTVSSETTTSLAAIPGREFRIALPNRGVFIERIYLAKVGGTHRTYMLITGSDFSKGHQDVFARFFDSFKIDASAAPPTLINNAMQAQPQPPMNPAAPPPQVNPRPRPRPPRPMPGRRPLHRPHP